eukprot:TRINITY_DN53604_c0_g1_i1.p1 TRINITY_DN53604_c0_g1~~TRINITY_DN53604_c0_g1_i1.p1  ORF type:complete len:319 (-),score=47.36 TRINITY_DN53604_c0_g1_i1:208-1068(-)
MGAAVTSEVCTGAGDFPAQLPVCYSAVLFGQTFGAKVLSQSSGTGVVETNSTLGTGGCTGEYAVVFTKTGQSISLHDVNNCGVWDWSYSISYCSDQDKLYIRVISPFAMNIEMPSGKCSSELFPAPEVQLSAAPTWQPQWPQLRGSVVALTQDQDACTGTGSFPRISPLCYNTEILLSAFAVKVLSHNNVAGIVSFGRTGKLTAAMGLSSCMGSVFTKHDRNLTIHDVSGCNLYASWNASFTYCSDQDKMRVHFSLPTTTVVDLNRGHCMQELFNKPALCEGTNFP